MRRFVCKSLLAAAAGRKSFNVDSMTQAVSSKDIFSPSLIHSATTEYGTLGFHESYEAHFSVTTIQEHLGGFLAAKANQKQGNPLFFAKESEKNAFYFCGGDHHSQMMLMKQLNEFIASRSAWAATHGVSVHSYHSKNNSTVLFTVDHCPFLQPAVVVAEDAAAQHAMPQYKEVDLKEVATKNFMEGKRESSKKRYADLLTRMENGFSTVFSITKIDNTPYQALSVAFRPDRFTYFDVLITIISEIPGAVIDKKFMETFNNGVQVYTFYIRGASASAIEEKATLTNLLPNRVDDSIMRLFSNKLFSAEEAIFSHCIIMFAFYFTPPVESDDFKAVSLLIEKETVALTRLRHLRQHLNQEIRSERHLGFIVSENATIVKKLFEDFKKGSTVQSRSPIEEEIMKLHDGDEFTRNILLSFLTFNAAVVKHNFNKVGKAALAFRLDPTVFIPKLSYPRVPHGIFFFVGPMWRGFHIRFTDIARGGVRLILSDDKKYKRNKVDLFGENYNLALTQLLKNKDIPEGGGKGTILVSTRIKKVPVKIQVAFFLQYVDAMLDVILPNQSGVVDNFNQNEIIFLGPDENTAGAFPTIGAMHAKSRGYIWWKSFTTGKYPSIGGIPHDTYGMTTRSVRQCVDGLYRKLGLDGTKLTKLQTGGPDGDLGSNEILMGNERTTSVVDGSGVVHDPNGLNVEELKRLAKNRDTILHFNRSKLSKNGFLIAANKMGDAKGVTSTLPDGTIIANSVQFRDSFHFSKYATADVFVPCGGRPRSVTLSTVHKFLLNAGPTITGTAMLKGEVKVQPADLKYKYIVEGANLFFSHDARIALEKCGVVIIKDAAANKGGVTSSSIEVFTGMALTDEEHSTHMCVKEEGGRQVFPQFYEELVRDICRIVENNALREFELIWREHLLRPSEPKTNIIDKLSRKIVELRGSIYRSQLFDDKKFVRYILDKYTPPTLLKKVNADVLQERVPENYLKAICSVWLAADYVYTCGVEAGEFEFYDFMRAHRSKA